MRGETANGRRRRVAARQHCTDLLVIRPEGGMTEKPKKTTNSHRRYRLRRSPSTPRTDRSVARRSPRRSDHRAVFLARRARALDARRVASRDGARRDRVAVVVRSNPRFRVSSAHRGDATSPFRAARAHSSRETVPVYDAKGDKKAPRARSPARATDGTMRRDVATRRRGDDADATRGRAARTVRRRRR